MRRALLLGAVTAGLVMASCGGPRPVTEDELTRARARWEAHEPSTYHWRADGSVDGRGIDVDLIVDDGAVVSANGTVAAELGVDGLFDQMRDAIEGGLDVRASFDEVGYPTQVVIDDRVDLTTRDFDPIERPVGCRSAQGSATDLGSEPATMLLGADLHRWTDGAGCLVRVDVIGQSQGPAHCGRDGDTFITLGTPIGASFADGAAAGARTFVWGPTSATAGDASDAPARGGAPSTAFDSGFRDGTAEMWFDHVDPTVLYRIGDGETQVFVIEEAAAIACM